MDEIIENIQEAYREGLRKAKLRSDIICPYCEEEDFDLIGLKSHFIVCEKFQNTKLF